MQAVVPYNTKLHNDFHMPSIKTHGLLFFLYKRTVRNETSSVSQDLIYVDIYLMFLSSYYFIERKLIQFLFEQHLTRVRYMLPQPLMSFSYLTSHF